MNALDVLMQDHREIEHVLDLLENLAAGVRRGRGLDLRTAKAALTFLVNFVDRDHHRKEEDVLFPALVEKGFPRAGGPLEVMSYEHELAREHVRIMTQALENADEDFGSALPLFVHTAEEYIDLLRRHIAKEDGVLFAMARHALSAEELDRLGSSFETMENDVLGGHGRESMLQLSRDLQAHSRP